MRLNQKDVEEAATTHSKRFITDSQWESQNRIESFTFGAKWAEKAMLDRVASLKKYIKSKHTALDISSKEIQRLEKEKGELVKQLVMIESFMSLPFDSDDKSDPRVMLQDLVSKLRASGKGGLSE